NVRLAAMRGTCGPSGRPVLTPCVSSTPSIQTSPGWGATTIQLNGTPVAGAAVWPAVVAVKKFVPCVFTLTPGRRRLAPEMPAVSTVAKIPAARVAAAVRTPALVLPAPIVVLPRCGSEVVPAGRLTTSQLNGTPVAGAVSSPRVVTVNQPA